MAEITSLQQKINSYLTSHAEMKGKSEAVILSAMQKEGIVTQAEIDSAKKTSAFGFGFNKTEDVGISVERTAPKVQTVAVNNPVKITHLELEQAQEYAIGSIHENLQKALEVYHSVDNGSITEGYDAMKNFFETELSSKNVSDVLNKEALSVAFLENAKNGKLTKREYYEKNKEHLQNMLMKRFTEQDETGVDALDKYKRDLSREEFAKLLNKYIQERIDTISTIEGIKDFQHEILMLDEEQNTQFVEKLATEAKKQDIVWTPDGPLMPKFKANFEKHPYDSDELMTFEETYLLERGVEFSQNRMDILMQSEGELEFVTSAYNKVNLLNTEIKEIQKEYRDQLGEAVDQKTGMVYSNKEPNPTPRKDKITQVISEYYMLNPEQAKKDLEEIIQKQQLNLKVELNENNELSIDFGERDKTDSQKNKNLNLLLNGLTKLQKERLTEVLGGKDYDTYLTTYKYNYENALGKQNAEELANAMKTDNMTVIDSVSGAVSMSGMAMMVVGGVLTLTPAAPLGATLTGVGGKVALGGMAARNALGLTEAYTRDEVNSEETKQRYKDLAMDVGGLIIGGYAGRTGLKFGNKLLNSGSNLLKAKLVEHGTDFAISVAGDLAMVGAMSYDQSIGETFKQNAIGIIVSTLTGISASKAIYINGTKGVDANTPKVDVPKTYTPKVDAIVKSNRTLYKKLIERLPKETLALLKKYNIDIENIQKPEHKSVLYARQQAANGTNLEIREVSNLTNQLKKIHYRTRSELKQLFDANPDIDRVVGSVPRAWGKSLQGANGVKAVDAAFSKFVNDIHHGKLSQDAISELQTELKSLLNTDVKVSKLSGGGFGTTYKIESDGRKYVLKLFGEDLSKNRTTHGGWAEISSAVYASDKTKNVAKFYMGKFGESDVDSYLLTRYIDDSDKDLKGYTKRNTSFNSNSDELRMQDMISKFYISDDRPSNYIGWKIVDYGQLGTTQYGKMSHDSYKILRQICEAADAKSKKRMQQIVEQYKNNPAMKEALEAYGDAICIARSEGYDDSILREYVKMLDILGDIWKPDFTYLAFHDHNSLPLFYDITSEEAKLLNNILNDLEDFKLNNDGVDYM